MAKKAQAQAAAAAAASAAIDPAESATTQVNIAEFTRTRDSVSSSYSRYLHICVTKLVASAFGDVVTNDRPCKESQY